MLEALSFLLAALVATGAFLAWREDQLRRADVLSWGLKCISALQTLTLTCSTPSVGTGLRSPSEAATELSVLVEQGRMFFRNASPDEFGQSKEQAYRGYRPVILDQLVFCFLVAQSWQTLSPSDRVAGAAVVTKCKERFVSLLQREVGRRRTADRYNREAGSGYDLASLLFLAETGKAPPFPEEEDGTAVRIRRLLRL